MVFLERRSVHSLNRGTDQAKALADFEKNAAQVARTVSLTAQALPHVIPSVLPVVPSRSPATLNQVRASAAAADTIHAFMKSDVEVPDAAEAAPISGMKTICASFIVRMTGSTEVFFPRLCDCTEHC